MKFNQSTLFFIILTVVLLSTVGMNIKEGMVDSNKQRASQQTNHRYKEEMSKRNDLYNDDDMHDRFWSERKGVRRVDIPDDDQDLYVLKSSIVPPVCPKCPQRSTCPRDKPAPPCPPCARCPEPSFTCKKVPNYNSMNNQYLPLPWLSQASSNKSW